MSIDSKEQNRPSKNEKEAPQWNLEIGRRLYERRTEKDLSIFEVELTTKISHNYIKDMENGDFHKLPGKHFAKGFLKSLCRCLDLDEKDILQIYQRYEPFEKPKNALRSQESSILRDKRLRKYSLPPFSRKRRKTASLFLLATCTILLLIYFKPFSFLKTSHEHSLSSMESLIETQKKSLESLNKEGKDYVLLTVFEDTRIKKKENSQENFAEKTFPRGVYTFFIEKSIHFVFENAGVIEAHHNGEDLGKLGNIGDSLEKTFYAAKKNSHNT